MGNVVLEIEPKTPRRNWRIGRIEEVYPGQDGLVRVVDVRIGGRVIRRPIHKLSPLEANVSSCGTLGTLIFESI